MEKIDTSLQEFRELDEISSGSSIVHKLNPVVKFICTIFYILIVVSFGKYQVSRLVIMVLYPFLLFELGGISFKGFLHKLRKLSVRYTSQFIRRIHFSEICIFGFIHI